MFMGFSAIYRTRGSNRTRPGSLIGQWGLGGQGGLTCKRADTVKARESYRTVGS